MTWDQLIRLERRCQVCVLLHVCARTDAEHGDADSASGGLQHRSAAQKPWEEPLHGRAASRPLPALPHHHRRGELQLHQRCAHGCTWHTHTHTQWVWWMWLQIRSFESKLLFHNKWSRLKMGSWSDIFSLDLSVWPKEMWVQVKENIRLKSKPIRNSESDQPSRQILCLANSTEDWSGEHSVALPSCCPAAAAFSLSADHSWILCEVLQVSLLPCCGDVLDSVLYLEPVIWWR